MLRNKIKLENKTFYPKKEFWGLNHETNHLHGSKLIRVYLKTGKQAKSEYNFVNFSVMRTSLAGAATKIARKEVSRGIRVLGDCCRGPSSSMSMGSMAIDDDFYS